MKGLRLVKRQAQGFVFFGGIVSFLLMFFFTASLAFAQNPCSTTSASGCGDARWPGLTPTVPQPTFPALCTTVVGSNGEPAGVLYALQQSGSFNESALDTTRLQNAINTCQPVPGAAAVGLELALNPNDTSCGSAACNAFLSAPLKLLAGLTLIIDPDVTLYADKSNGSSTPFIQVGVNNNSAATKYTGSGANGLGYWGIMGYGTIDGQGSVWGFTGNGPRLVALDSSDYFTLYGITLQNPGKEHFIGNGNYLLVYDAKISTPANTSNTDGVDPAGSSNITIVNSFLSDGDDQIAFNAGNAKISNVTIAHNHLYAGHGISIGSYTTQGMGNAVVTDVAIDNNGNFGSESKNSLRIKSDSENGGEVKDILYNGVCIQNGGHILIFNPYYDSPIGSHYPDFHDITLQNINVLNHDSTGHNGASALEGYDTGGHLNPLTNVTLDNVVFNYTLAQFQSEFYATPTVGSTYGINYASFILGPDPVSFNTSVWDLLNGIDGITVTDNVSNSNPPYSCTGKYTYLAGELFAASSNGAPLASPLEVNAGNSVTLRAIVQPIVKSMYNSSKGFSAPATSGTLTFYDNGTLIDTVTNIGGQRITNYTISNVTAGTHVYTAQYSGDASYTTASGSVPTNPTNAVPPTFPSFTVNAVATPVTPVVTASNKTYDSTTTATITSCTLTGVLQNDIGNVTCAATAASFATANAGTGITVTATGITLSGTAAGSYSLSSTTATTTANIAAITVTPSVTAQNKVYDGTTTATITSCTLTGVLSADIGNVTCAAAGATFATANAGTGITVTATGITLSGTAAGNYALSSTTATTTANISQATPVLSVNCPTVTFNSKPQMTCTGTATGVGGAAVSGSFSFAPGSETNAGSYTETGTFTSTDPNNNYVSGGTATGTLTINQATPSLTISCPDVTYDGSAHSCTASATGVSGIGSAISKVHSLIQIVGNTVNGSFSCVPASETNAGVYSVTCTFASNDPNYVSGGTIGGTLTINAKPVTPTVTASNKTYDGTTSELIGNTTCTLSGVVGSDNLTCAGAAANFATSAVGNGITVMVTGISLSGSAASNYVLSSTTATTTANITAPASATLAISPASLVLNFGTQLVNTSSMAQYIGLTNTGSSPLLVSGATVTGGVFAISNQAGTCTFGMTLQPSRSCVIRVVFSPTSSGPVSGSVVINSAGAPAGSYTVTLNGTGTAPAAALTLSTTSVTFPTSEMVGQSSAAQYVQITSTGAASLQVTSVTVGGADPGDFIVTNQAGTCTTGATLAYHADCNLRVVFTPTAAGTRTATLFINDNVSGSPQQVTMSGTATSGAQLSLSASTLTFPATRVGSTAATEYLTIKSTGFAPLVINQVTLSSGDFTLSSQAGTCTTAATTTLAPGTNCNIRVQFHPTATGARTATVVINNNTATSPVTVTLNGTGE